MIYSIKKNALRYPVKHDGQKRYFELIAFDNYGTELARAFNVQSLVEKVKRP